MIPSVQYAYAGVEPSPFHVTNQLNAVGNVLSAQSDKMDRIKAKASNPPDDNIPEFNAALRNIKTECTAINDVADSMIIPVIPGN